MREAEVALHSLLDEGTRHLAAAGVREARREALRLWADLCGESPAAALLNRERPVAPDEAAKFDVAVARRAAGEPLAYVTGIAGFRRLHLAVDRRALIPRPETEGLVDLVLARQPDGVAADIGTGTGAIALSLATEGRYHAVIATDRSADALALAGENAARVAAAVHLVRADLTAPLAAGAVDALVANPPYLTEAEYAALDAAVRDWEPAAALVSGPDGLDATRRLLDDGRRVVRPGGWIALEVDCTRASVTADLARRFGWTEVAVSLDLFGRERYVLARRSARP